MFDVTRREAPFRAFVLRDTDARSEVEVVPARGGMVTRFTVAGEPLLAMDESTLADGTKNVRGGIPILFPTAGRLRDDLYRHRTCDFPMPQHGFARNLPWKVVRSGTDGGARITLALRSNAKTWTRFPFNFRLEFTYELEGKTLRIRQLYENASLEPMPLHAGFHPYFHVPEKEKARTVIETHASWVWDNVAKTEGPFQGIDLTLPEVDLHLMDPLYPKGSLTRPGRPPVLIECSSQFGHWVVWTLAGRDFVCLEPWTAPANALNSGERLLLVPPGGEQQLRVQITA